MYMRAVRGTRCVRRGDGRAFGHVFCIHAASRPKAQWGFFMLESVPIWIWWTPKTKVWAKHEMMDCSLTNKRLKGTLFRNAAGRGAMLDGVCRIWAYSFRCCVDITRPHLNIYIPFVNTFSFKLAPWNSVCVRNTYFITLFRCTKLLRGNKQAFLNRRSLYLRLRCKIARNVNRHARINMLFRTFFAPCSNTSKHRMHCNC